MTQKKKSKVKMSFIEFSPGIMAPQFDIGYKTDAVKEIRKMRDYKLPFKKQKAEVLKMSFIEFSPGVMAPQFDFVSKKSTKTKISF